MLMLPVIAAVIKSQYQQEASDGATNKWRFPLPASAE